MSRSSSPGSIPSRIYPKAVAFLFSLTLAFTALFFVGLMYPSQEILAQTTVQQAQDQPISSKDPEEIRQFLETLELTDEEREFLQQFYEMKGLPAAPSIVGGNDADVADYPWQVALTSASGFQFCGGSVVDAEWILTAAHCLGGSLPYIRAGVTNINDNTGQDRAVVQQFSHPDFISVTSGDDIALLRLAEPLDLTDPNVAIIPIATQAHRDAGFEDPGVTSVITGWGALYSGGPSPDILQVVEAPIVSNEQAQTGYPSETITDDMIAAGVWGVGGKDACQGDSGGPLAVPFEGSPVGYVIAGITSWGYGCANATEMGMYARVSYFQQWLEQTSGLSWPGPDGYPAANIPEVQFDLTMLTNETTSQSFTLGSVGNYGLNYSLRQYFEPTNILDLPGFEALKYESQQVVSHQAGRQQSRAKAGVQQDNPIEASISDGPTEGVLTEGVLVDSVYAYEFDNFSASGGQFVPVAETGFEGVITEITGNFVLNSSTNSTWASDFAVIVTNSSTFSPTNAILQVGGYDTISQNRYEWGTGDSGTPGTSIDVTIPLDQPISGANLHVWVGNGWTSGGSQGTWSGSIAIPGIDAVPNLITNITPSSGRIEPGFSEEITVEFSSVDFEPGIYERMLLLQTNDPNQTQTFFPVKVTVLDENGSLSDFESTLTITDNAGNQTSLTFGTAPNATAGFDEQYDQIASAPPVPGQLDARFQTQGSDYFAYFQRSTQTRTEWSLAISAPESAFPVTLTWDPALLTEAGFFRLYGSQNGMTTNAELKKTEELILNSPEDAVLTLEHVKQKSFDLTYSENWNLVALPLEKEHQQFTDIFPTAYPNALFSFDGNYKLESRLQMGQGYWVRLTSEDQQTFGGDLPDHQPAELRKGWNIIAANSYCEPYCEITDPLGVISEGSVFEFNNGYSQTSQLSSGRGYWARTSTAGTVELALAGISSSESSASSVFSNTSEFLDELNDQSVSIHVQQSENNLQTLFLAYKGDRLTRDEFAFSLPPVPPTGSPDVRFANDVYAVSGISGVLELQQTGEPLSLTLEEGHKATLSVASSEKHLYTIHLTGGKPHILPAEAVTTEIQLTTTDPYASEVPEDFALAQNTPNPFNPTTLIQYSLPVDARVDIAVYNMLGQKVAGLQNGLQKAGTYALPFDASSLSSGIYLYRITAVSRNGDVPPFQSVRKMTLLK